MRYGEYSKSIAAHARRTSATSLYPGQNYRDLSQWLESRKEQESPRTGDHCLAVLCDFSLKGSGRLQHLRATLLKTISDPPNQPRSVKEAGRVLLLRVCPPANWIITIGAKFGIDPEFVHRHLDFFATLPARSAFALPSLRSSSDNIVRLCTCTIVSRDASVTPIRKSDM